MPAPKPAVALGVTFALGACAVALPTGPAVLVLPPEGKDLARFQQEDGSCRQHAAVQTGGDAYASRAGLQQRYDLAYAQCMAAGGNRVQQALPAAPYYPPYYYWPYAYPAYYIYPAYYGPWFGPAVGVGFFGDFGHHYHHAERRVLPVVIPPAAPAERRGPPADSVMEPERAHLSSNQDVTAVPRSRLMSRGRRSPPVAC